MLPEIKMDNPELITYFDTEENLQYYKWKTIRLGRFLQQHFSHIYTHDQITKLTEQTIGEYKSMEVKKVQTTEELEQVFRQGSWGSCCEYKDWPKDTPHPALIYWSPDIEIFYISKGNKTLTRAICNANNKAYMLFGNYPQRNILQNYLDKQGYKAKQWGVVNDSFHGIKLNKIEYKGKIIACHTDPCEYGIDMGDHFLTTSKDKCTHMFLYTDGYAKVK